MILPSISYLYREDNQPFDRTYGSLREAQVAFQRLSGFARLALCFHHFLFLSLKIPNAVLQDVSTRLFRLKLLSATNVKKIASGISEEEHFYTMYLGAARNILELHPVGGRLATAPAL
eukprot:IDg12347t1